MSTSLLQRYEKRTKLAFGYFHMYGSSVLMPNVIIQIVIKYVHVAMRWETCAEDCIMTENVIELSKHHGRWWRLFYSLPVSTIGYHKWEVKVINSPENIMYIGICSKNDVTEGGIWSYKDCCWYIWGSEKSRGRWETNLNETRVDEMYHTGDIISVMLSDDQLAFSKNDENAWKTIKINITEDDRKYYLVVLAFAAKTKLEMLSYSNCRK